MREAHNSSISIYNGNCLEIMKNIHDGSVDLVLTDPPYGMIACKWDSVIPLKPMWEELKSITKPLNNDPPSAGFLMPAI